MKFGVREICDVVLKAKSTQKIGNKIFYKNEPVMYFDTLKTSTLEGAATTVYATGGRGNSRLVSWEGERTVTFTMEDALISPEGFMILSGAGLIDASEKPVYQHVTETVDGSDIMFIDKDGNKTEAAIAEGISIRVSEKPYLPTEGIGIEGDYAYVMLVKDGEIISEPFIPVHEELDALTDDKGEKYYLLKVLPHYNYNKMGVNEDEGSHVDYYIEDGTFTDSTVFDSAIVDYYVEHTSNAQQIEITADKFGGNYYLEASTLFRDQSGVDMPAEFVIPNCNIQSNFNFTMASSGDPSTFTFTMDAFPDYTRFDKSKKVLAAIQIIKDTASQDLHRHRTVHEAAHNALF